MTATNGNGCQSFLALRLKVLTLEQNTPEWLEIRKTKRTASETPIVLGMSPWKTPGELAMEKFGTSKPFAGNKATEHGHRFEGRARQAYETEQQRSMEPCVVVRGKYLASLDGWSDDHTTVLEIKCPYGRASSKTWQSAQLGKVEDHYYYQIQHQLMVSGASRCHLWVYDTDELQGALVRIPRNLGAFTRILNAWEAFVKRYV